MKRLFAAINIPRDEQLKYLLKNLKAELSHESIKWVDAENLHLTLKFFGETDEGRIAPICKALSNAAETSFSFDLSISETGIFGSSYEPRVLWAGLDGGDELELLFNNINDELQEIGIFADRQNFVPHISLGRIKKLQDKKYFQRIIDNYRDFKSGPHSVKSFSLMESRLHKQGPEYIFLEDFRLVE